VHRDQLGAQPGGAAAGAGHGGGDVVKLEIQKHPLALPPQLPHHLGPRRREQLQPYLHPAQLRNCGGQGQGPGPIHPIKGNDDPLGGGGGRGGRRFHGARPYGHGAPSPVSAAPVIARPAVTSEVLLSGTALVSIQGGLRAGHHEWTCFGCHQGVVKALKALHLRHGHHPSARPWWRR